jgi:basic membrane protein A and related proteins
MNGKANRPEVVFVVAFVIAGCSSFQQPRTGEEVVEAIKVGFITVGPSADMGFNESHASASRNLGSDDHPITATLLENIPENAEAERAIEKLVDDNNLVIFATSYGHLDAALKLARQHPQVKFMHCGGQTTATNLATYSAYIHEPMYLAGIVAGRSTQSDRLGFVAANRIPQVYWSINAFTLGARSVNPDTIVHVVFTNSWSDPGLEAEASEGLIDIGVDVLAMHLDSPATVVRTAEKRGVYSIGMHLDVHEIAPNGWLTGAVWNWEEFYRKTAISVKDGTWSSQSHCLGIRDGVVDLASFGRAVLPETIKEIEESRKRLKSADLVVFRGPVFDNQGRTMLEENELPSQEWLGQMNWFVAGVNR